MRSERVHGATARETGEAAIDLTASGQVRIRTGSTEIGQGTRTIFPQIAAKTLGIPIGLVDLHEIQAVVWHP